MIKKILAVLAAIGGVLSSIFFVLFKQAKEEQKAETEKREKAEKAVEAEKAAQKKENEVRKENEEKHNKIHSSDNLDAFSSVTDILQND